MSKIENINVRDFLYTHQLAKEAKCFIGEGFLRALVIKISNWFSGQGPEGVINTLFQKLQNDELSAVTLRWFSQEQLTRLCDKVSENPASQNVLRVFERTIGLTSGDTQSALVSKYYMIEAPKALIQRLVEEEKIPNRDEYTNKFVEEALRCTPPNQRQEILLLAYHFNLSFARDSEHMISDTIHVMNRIERKGNENIPGAMRADPKVKVLDMEMIRLAVAYGRGLVFDISSGPCRNPVLESISELSKDEVGEVVRCAKLLCEKFKNKDVWHFRGKIIEVVSLMNRRSENVIKDLIEQVPGDNFNSLKQFFDLLFEEGYVAKNPNILTIF